MILSRNMILSDLFFKAILVLDRIGVGERGCSYGFYSGVGWSWW